MLITKLTGDDIPKYIYLSSEDKDNYTIKVREFIGDESYTLTCDLYDLDSVGYEILSLDIGDWLEVIPADEIEECPILKGFYIARRKSGAKKNY